MLHLSAISSPALGLLKTLMIQDAFSEARLVGGTALALQIGHRKSIDLDIFGEIDFDKFNKAQLFGNFNEVKTIKSSQNINIFIIDRIKVDFVNYTYSWLEMPIVEKNIRLAGLKDIAAMKLAAITGRGSKKDFIDIYFLLKQFDLATLMNFYNKKYFDGSEYLVLKSLTYFQDAEEDPMPEMIVNGNWNNVKETIIEEVRSLA